jgi:hypothetical protein
VATGPYPGPVGRLLQCAANGACSSLATITFPGEQQDITDPEAAVLDTGRRRNANVLSASRRSTTCRVTPTRSPAGPSPSRVDGSPTPSVMRPT